MDTSEYTAGDYLRPEDIKKLVVPEATIISEALIVEDTPFGKPVLQVEIELSNHEQKIYGMNRTSAKHLQESWGFDSANWVGKRISFNVVKQMVSSKLKDVLYASPAEQIN